MSEGWGQLKVQKHAIQGVLVHFDGEEQCLGGGGGN